MNIHHYKLDRKKFCCIILSLRPRFIYISAHLLASNPADIGGKISMVDSWSHIPKALKTEDVDKWMQCSQDPHTNWSFLRFRNKERSQNFSCKSLDRNQILTKCRITKVEPIYSKPTKKYRQKQCHAELFAISGKVKTCTKRQQTIGLMTGQRRWQNKMKLKQVTLRNLFVHLVNDIYCHKL